jgi:hypothetical protein
MSLIRHCPTCATDYRPEITLCAECGGELLLRPEEESELPPPDLPPGDYRAIYYSGEIGDLEPLTDALARAGMPYRGGAVVDAKVALPPSHNRFELKVRDDDREAAVKTLEALPEAAELGIVDDLAEKGFDPARGYLNCPACGAALPAGALKCSECDLALGGSLEPLFCSACQWEVSSTDSRCPHCGESLEE